MDEERNGTWREGMEDLDQQRKTRKRVAVYRMETTTQAFV
jgi:hypothetical protein